MSQVVPQFFIALLVPNTDSNNSNMKKTLRSLKLACLAAVSMLVVSCGGGADYRNLLPADSFMTMSVNPASLLQKSDAGDIGQHPLFIRLKAELDKAEGITAEEKEYLLALLKNPCESVSYTHLDVYKRQGRVQQGESDDCKEIAAVDIMTRARRSAGRGYAGV